MLHDLKILQSIMFEKCRKPHPAGEIRAQCILGNPMVKTPATWDFPNIVYH